MIIHKISAIRVLFERREMKNSNIQFLSVIFRQFSIIRVLLKRSNMKNQYQ